MMEMIIYQKLIKAEQYGAKMKAVTKNPNFSAQSAMFIYAYALPMTATALRNFI